MDKIQCVADSYHLCKQSVDRSQHIEISNTALPSKTSFSHGCPSSSMPGTYSNRLLVVNRIITPNFLASHSICI